MIDPHSWQLGASVEFTKVSSDPPSLSLAAGRTDVGLESAWATGAGSRRTTPTACFYSWLRNFEASQRKM